MSSTPSGMRRTTLSVYGLLALTWLSLVAWQVFEHKRVRRSVEDGELNHAQDIAKSLAVVIRSQRRFGTVPRDRLVSALEDLAQSRELLGIALLSPAGEIVAAGGQGIPGDLGQLEPGKPNRSDGRLVVASIVELGAERIPRPPGEGSRGPDLDDAKASGAVVWSPPEPPAPTTAEETTPDDGQPPVGSGEATRRRDRWERLRRSHPFWQPPEKYREIYEKQGVHMMVLMLDDLAGRQVLVRDRVARVAMAVVAFLAVAGFGVAWRGQAQSSQLQLRLVRARAMNTHLRELNLAAAGLAHETRNPLNVVRGIAQMILRDASVPPGPRENLGTAIEEVDRITARLNEFIDYSRPREPQPTAVRPAAVARDVARTLEADFEDKRIEFECIDDGAEIMADGTMLRQVLFNLLLNAAQAVPAGGCVTVTVAAQGPNVTAEVADNGPGVPEDAREAIFRPYFSLSAHGSGLGLAVVRQIALAHGWDVSYHPRPEGGSLFRISNMARAGRQGA